MPFTMRERRREREREWSIFFARGIRGSRALCRKIRGEFAFRLVNRSASQSARRLVNTIEQPASVRNYLSSGEEGEFLRNVVSLVSREASRYFPESRNWKLFTIQGANNFSETISPRQHREINLMKKIKRR